MVNPSRQGESQSLSTYHPNPPQTLTGAAGLSSAVSGRLAATRWKPLNSWLLVTSLLSVSLSTDQQDNKTAIADSSVSHKTPPWFKQHINIPAAGGCVYVLTKSNPKVPAWHSCCCPVKERCAAYANPNPNTTHHTKCKTSQVCKAPSIWTVACQ